MAGMTEEENMSKDDKKQKPGKPKAPPDKPTVAKGDWVKK